MALFLYRLGRLAARRAWLTILTWVLVLGALGGAMAAFASPPSSAISIPGAEFQRVLDKLGTKIPAAAGGMGTITIENENGPITAEQRTAIEQTIEKWKKSPHVDSVMNPFENQQTIDDGRAQYDEGKAQYDDGLYKVRQGEWLYDQGVKDLAAARDELAELEANGQGQSQRARELRVEIPARVEGDAEIKKQVDDGRAQLDDARVQLSEGHNTLALSDGLRFISEDGSVALLQIQYDEVIAQLSPEIRAQVPEIGEELTQHGLRVDYNADILQTRSIIGIGEVIGFGIAAAVLLVMLGSLIAAGLPLLVALVGVGAGLLAAMASSAFFEMNSMTPALALMLGLAVGIDYALFIVNRHRQQLLEGMPLHHSIGVATGTAGNAVVVAGITVIIALTALTVSGLPILAQMGLVAAGTVAMTVLVALTLTPAVLSLMGRRVISKRGWRKHEERQAAHADGKRTSHRGSGRWAVRVTNRPWLSIVLTVLAIGLLSIPALSLRLGLPDGSSEPRDSSSFHSYVTIEEHFGAGANGPLVAVVSFDDPVAKDDLTATQNRFGRELFNLPGVERVVPFGVSEPRDTIAFQVVPSEGPTSEATVQLVHDMEDLSTEMPPGAHLGLTGQTVANIEISERLAQALPLYVVLVVGLSLLLLMAVFRSVLVPLVATGGFLLSVAAGFGSVVAVYQWGWLGDLLDVSRPGPIMPFMPTLLIGVLFGLAMDYQMFLVSGMHEAHAHGQDSRTAIRTGFRQGYRVVTAAALIMISVFAGFIFAHLSMIRPMGLGLAIGVAVDAFLVRMTLTPAVLHLLGDKAWWIPRWLDRLLPDLDVEGSKLRSHLEQEEAAAADAPRDEAGDDVSDELVAAGRTSSG